MRNSVTPGVTEGHPRSAGPRKSVILSAHEQRALNENLLPPKQQIALPKLTHWQGLNLN